MVLFQKRQLYFSRDPEGVQPFSRGGPTFSWGEGGGPTAYFYRNPYNM